MTKLRKLDPQTIKLIAETAIDKYKEAEEVQVKLRQDRRLHNVKQLMANYKRIQQSVSQLKKSDVDDEAEALDLEDLMSSEHMVESLNQSKVRSRLMINHVDRTLTAYKHICTTEDVQERYQIIYDRYINNIPPHKLWEKYSLSRRTFYREVDRACEDLSVLLFGVDAVNFKVQ